MNLNRPDNFFVQNSLSVRRNLHFEPEMEKNGRTIMKKIVCLNIQLHAERKKEKLSQI